MNPPLEVHIKLLWREFFFLVGSQMPVAHEMVNNSLSLQIPWEDSPEYLDKWKQVSLTIICLILLSASQWEESFVLAPFLEQRYDIWFHCRLWNFFVSCTLWVMAKERVKRTLDGHSRLVNHSRFYNGWFNTIFLNLSISSIGLARYKET